MRVSLLSLGCAKNLADSEGLLRGLRGAGIDYAPGPEGADVMLVNTCGFIEDAKKESIEEILRLARFKDGKRRLLVFGCLAGRYKEEILREMPEIDAIFGVGEEEGILDYCLGLSGRRPRPYSPDNGRMEPVLYDDGLSPYAAPLKVAEGCSRRCSYCVIPSVRGPFRSREPEEILKEAEALVGAGTRELMLVAQDLTSFRRGEPGWKGYGLGSLLRDLSSIEGDFWIRPMYLYPTAIDDGVLEAMADEPKICKYVDMPVQHSEDRMLRLMRRRGSREGYLRLISRIRRAVPDVVLRTTLIVGFPGEGGEEFRGLMEFVGEAEFERLGAFPYSREEGTPAASMKGQVAGRIKKSRLERIMGLQKDISLRKNMALKGRRLRVLIEDVEGDTALGRTQSQAPEIDGCTIVRGARDLEQGGFADILITKAYEYDMEGEPC
jgi:ribosomal protein S12 methylthiotransferase